MKKKYIFHCLCYCPKVFSGLDRFTIMLADRMAEDNYQNVFVFYETLKETPAYRKALEEKGYLIVLLPEKAGKRAMLKEYLYCFRKYRPEIVHVHFTALFKLFNAALRLFYPFKLIVSFHSTVNPYASYREYRKEKGLGKTFLYRCYCRFIYQQSDAVICVSRSVERQYVQFLNHTGKVRCLYLGVNRTNVSREEAEKRLDINDRKAFRICHISAFEWLKGIDVIIRAACLLKEEYRLNDFLVYLIGKDRRDDNYSGKMKELAVELQVDKHIVWLGKRLDIQEILPAFDVYVQPSRFEGLPVALMEASSAGLPLIGTKVGGIPEIIIHQVNGFLIERDSPNQLASYLYKLYQDKKYRHEMAIRSKEKWDECFNVEKQVRELYTIYN